MGIQGLIPFLKKASRPVNVTEYSGCTVAVDAYCWLHKGAFSCAEKLAKGEYTEAYVYYCMKFVNMLLSHDIKPILVFDGRHLAAKANTEKKRRESREQNRRKAAEMLRAGKIQEARDYFRRCTDVTPDMALKLIQECRRRNVDCIVAPFEADAQLAFLNKKNIVQLVITEDSDLVLFGCNKILFKMDIGGSGLLVEKERLHLAMGVRPENFTFDKFRHMCILSGCDYLPSLPGIGLGKACRFVTRTSSQDISSVLKKLPMQLNMTNLQVTQDYIDGFLEADHTFLYQLVYDPVNRTIVPLNTPPDGTIPSKNAGEPISPTKALNLALGNLNPLTLEKMDNFNPDVFQSYSTSMCKSNRAPHKSIWEKDFVAKRPLAKENLKAVAFETTRGKQVVKSIKFSSSNFGKRCLDVMEEESQSEADLTSMYHDNHSSPVKKPRTEESDDDDEVENAAETNGSEIPTENSPEQSPNDECTSPIISRKRTKNPFAKVDSEKSLFEVIGTDIPQPSKETSTSNTPSQKKFSALSKFGKLSRTVVDPSTVIRSRYFSSSDPQGTKPSSTGQAFATNAPPLKVSSDNDQRPLQCTDRDILEEKLANLERSLCNGSENSSQENKSGKSSLLKTDEADNGDSDGRNSSLKSKKEQVASSLSRFKWTKDLTSLKNISSSPTAGKEFKPVRKINCVKDDSCEPTGLVDAVSDSPNKVCINDLLLSANDVDDSGIECTQSSIGSSSTLTQKSDCSVSEEESLTTPKSQVIQATPKTAPKKSKVCRVSGLSRSKVNKQQSLLSQFGFQRRSAPVLQQQSS